MAAPKKTPARANISSLDKHTEEIKAHVADAVDKAKDHITDAYSGIMGRLAAIDAKVDQPIKEATASHWTPFIAAVCAVGLVALGWWLRHIL